MPPAYSEAVRVSKPWPDSTCLWETLHGTPASPRITMCLLRTTGAMGFMFTLMTASGQNVKGAPSQLTKLETS